MIPVMVVREKESIMNPMKKQIFNLFLGLLLALPWGVAVKPCGKSAVACQRDAHTCHGTRSCIHCDSESRDKLSLNAPSAPEAVLAGALEPDSEVTAQQFYSLPETTRILNIDWLPNFHPPPVG